MSQMAAPSTSIPPKPPALNTQKFTPPLVEVGQIVHWWAYGETERAIPLPAIVVSVGTRTIALGILKPQIRSVDQRDGVRHVEDPEARREEFMEMGAWSHTETTRSNSQAKNAYTHFLEAKVKDFEGRLENLEAQLGELMAPTKLYDKTEAQILEEAGLSGLSDEEIRGLLEKELAKKG